MFRRKNSYKLLDLINSFQSSSLDYLRFKRQLLSGFAFFVALLNIVFAFTAYNVVLKDRETARLQVESFAQAIEAHVQYSIESVDFSLISSSNAMKILPVRQGSDAAIIEQLLARSQDTNVDESVNTVRKVITELRPSVLDQLGIWSALEWYADQFGQQASIQRTVFWTPWTASILSRKAAP